MRASILWKTSGKISGILKHIVVAAVIGLSVRLDIFYMGMALMGVFVFTWARMIEVITVPTLVELNSKDNNQFLKLTGDMFTFSVLVSIILFVLIVLFRDYLVKIAWGFGEDKRQKLSEAMLWFSPVALLYVPFHYVGSVFRSVRRFSLFYKAEFIIAIVTLACIILYRNEENVLMWSFSTGIVSAIAYMLFEYGRYFKFYGNPLSKEVINVLKIAPGLLVLQCASYLYILSDRIFITFLPSGSIGALAYGRTLSFIWEDLIGIKGSFITVFSESKKEHDRNRLYNDLISMAIYMAIPITLFLLAFGENIITLFLERGMFQGNDTDLVYLAMSGFAWSILPMFLQVPLIHIFQISGRIDLMVKRTICGLIINVFFNSLFIFILKWGVWGIAMATSISYWVVLLYSLIASLKLNLIVQIKRHIGWICWLITGTVISVLILMIIGNHISGIAEIVIKSVLYIAFTVTIGIYYPGVEGTLVKMYLKRILKRQ